VPEIARIVVAAPGSGHGKTTVATGLMAALRGRGLAVSGHKVGPDYIDPGYHALGHGRHPRNLDPMLQGEHRVLPLFLHGALDPGPADIAVVEGVMGLFDGAVGREGTASTAHVARLIDAPVLLVVDVCGSTRSVAATVHGFATFDPSVRIGGVVLNRVATQRQEDEVREAMAGTGVPVLGCLRRDEALATPSRHLGLVPAAERAQQAVAAVRHLGERVASGVDLDAVLRLARSAPAITAAPWDPAEEIAGLVRSAGQRPGDLTAGPGRDRPPVRIAAAGGRAFTFRYRETDELLAAAGAEVVDLDPLREESLPPGTDAVYLGGGFPEVYAEQLSANVPLRTAVARAVAGGLPVVAECAGLLYLCRELDGHPMVGALDCAGTMSQRLTLGYREAEVPRPNLVARPGEVVVGHEFHRTRIESAAGAGEAGRGEAGAGGAGAGGAAWRFRDLGYGGRSEGFARGNLHASYLHVHWAGHPRAAVRLVAAAGDRTAGPR
jgi:cobyrinic acid a,c-diamide synthase